LKYVADNAGGQRRSQNDGLAIRCQENDSGPAIHFLEFGCRIQSAQTEQIDIDDSNVWRESQNLAHERKTILDNADDFTALVEALADCFQHGILVLGDQDRNDMF
jgi:hypothetical protein